jgi:hypothetical protein
MFNITIEELKQNLQGSTPVHFSYLKVDGTMRNATGTLNEKLISTDFKPKDSSRNLGNNFKYFDLDKKAWRSLKMDCSLVVLTLE